MRQDEVLFKIAERVKSESGTLTQLSREEKPSALAAPS